MFTPTFFRNFNLSVDWFNINVMNAVGTLPANDVLTACLDDNLLAACSEQICDEVDV